MVQKKLSVKEIAEMAGTSVATVSRVINQNGRFSKDTEKRVKEIIEKYHYDELSAIENNLESILDLDRK